MPLIGLLVLKLPGRNTIRTLTITIESLLTYIVNLTAKLLVNLNSFADDGAPGAEQSRIQSDSIAEPGKAGKKRKKEKKEKSKTKEKKEKDKEKKR